jgi:hypothetical protein
VQQISIAKSIIILILFLQLFALIIQVKNRNFLLDLEQIIILSLNFKEKPLSDYQLVPQTQLGVFAQTKLYNVSVENCAELCTREDNYFCRSFDYFLDTSQCQLYKENLKDKIYTDLVITQNANSNHYSSWKKS